MAHQYHKVEATGGRPPGGNGARCQQRQRKRPERPGGKPASSLTAPANAFVIYRTLWCGPHVHDRGMGWRWNGFWSREVAVAESIARGFSASMDLENRTCYSSAESVHWLARHLTRARSAGSDEAAEGRRLAADAAAAETSPRLANMRAQRASLPAASARKEVLQQLLDHQVVVVSGATGALKT